MCSLFVVIFSCAMIKRVVLLGGLFFFLGMKCTFSQVPEDAKEEDEVTRVLEKISAGMKTGNYKDLLPMLFDRVYINLNNDPSRYTKREAEAILAIFVKKNPPSDYSYIHHGSSSEQQLYYIARYLSANTAYRVSWFLKKHRSTYRIYSVSFIKEESP